MYILIFLEQSKYPYLSTVILNGIQYGIGTGSTKKQAKLDSARATLQILLPSVKHFQTDNFSQTRNGIQENNHLEQYKVGIFNKCQIRNYNYSIYSYILCFQIFDKLNINDSIIPEICAQSTESTPYEMLKLCVKKYEDLFNF